jgi:D-arabinose 1-dehydrogenase-like Zn-dependent alcohol dehydrogenase
MATMRAMLLREWGGRLTPAEVERPAPQADEVLIKVEACGVGLTVVNNIAGMLGNRPEQLPRVPGHEIAGTVAEVGTLVTTLRPGDRVVNYVYLSCGSCAFCRRARESLCLNLRGFPGVDVDGGYAEYICLPAANLAPLPAEIPFVEATTIPDAITTSYHVCSARANVRPDGRVLVLGAAGGVGVHLLQMIRVFGGTAIAVDIDDVKLARSGDYGAARLVNFRDPGAWEAVLAATDGRGPDVIVDLVGRPETLEWSLYVLGRAGPLVLLTTFRDIGGTFTPRQLVLEEVTVTGSRYASKFELLAAIRLVRDGRIRPIVSEVVPLERVEELHDKLRRAEFFARGAALIGAAAG